MNHWRILACHLWRRIRLLSRKSHGNQRWNADSDQSPLHTSHKTPLYSQKDWAAR
jgi:hypothetical protein